MVGHVVTPPSTPTPRRQRARTSRVGSGLCEIPTRAVGRRKGGVDRRGGGPWPAHPGRRKRKKRRVGEHRGGQKWERSRGPTTIKGGECERHPLPGPLRVGWLFLQGIRPRCLGHPTHPATHITHEADDRTHTHTTLKHRSTPSRGHPPRIRRAVCPGPPFPCPSRPPRHPHRNQPRPFWAAPRQTIGQPRPWNP